MQWWGALTQQFQQIAATAMRDAARAAAPAADGGTENAPDLVAAGARQNNAGGSKSTEKKAVTKRPAKKAAPKTPKAGGAKPAAKKAPAKKAAAPKDGAAKSTMGWPLPPPFKLGR
ncbi:hypothetical protein [Ottowia testudinis]|uniref:hypothetical protein n=1 Tax=Ottowia testudinis TaxID=2816950 RepID=UPI0032669C0B